MWRIPEPSMEMPLEQERSAPPKNPGKAGSGARRLAVYGLATIALTYLLVRPRGGPSFGSGGPFAESGALAEWVRSMRLRADARPAPAARRGITVAASAHAAPSAPRPVAVASTLPVTPSPITGAATGAANAATQPAPAVADSTPVPPTVELPAQAKPKAAARPATMPAPNTRFAQSDAPTVASKPAAPGASPQLGQKHVDTVNGYSMQFLPGWTCTSLSDGGPWVLDASDGKTAVISVGFSPFPATVTTQQINPVAMTRTLKARRGTVVHAEGFGILAGRKCVWHKYTSHIPRARGSPRMTVVHYLLPLQDGRALELRVAAVPKRFAEMAPSLKQSVETFRLLTAQANAR